MVLVRIAWLALFAAAVAGVVAASRADRPDRLAVAAAIVPLWLASILAVAALAVTSVTSERDRGTLDLLLVSDLEPAEFVWGKLLGVIAAAREIAVLPLVLCIALVPAGVATLEQGLFMLAGLAVLCLAAGGGKHGPLYAAAGARVGVPVPVGVQAYVYALRRRVPVG
jgi:ABC-type Na+ efflux pump permease subunit